MLSPVTRPSKRTSLVCLTKKRLISLAREYRLAQAAGMLDAYGWTDLDVQAKRGKKKNTTQLGIEGLE
jgi:hypothetical protein